LFARELCPQIGVTGSESETVKTLPAPGAPAGLSGVYDLAGLEAGPLASSMPRQPYRGPPMTLGNMRENGVRALSVYCWGCHHDAVLAVDKWSDDVTVPSFGPRARPNWSERPVRPSLTGWQWR
jgi:hypothetical protein